jgi:hypothetical protein
MDDVLLLWVAPTMTDKHQLSEQNWNLLDDSFMSCKECIFVWWKRHLFFFVLSHSLFRRRRSIFQINLLIYYFWIFIIILFKIIYEINFFFDFIIFHLLFFILILCSAICFFFIIFFILSLIILFHLYFMSNLIFNFDWLKILIHDFYRFTFYKVTRSHDLGHEFWRLSDFTTIIFFYFIF